MNRDSQYEKYMQHPENTELSKLYTIVVSDTTQDYPTLGSKGAELGLCYFADQQIDRSPTGSVASARVAHAYALGNRTLGESWIYHSLVSLATRERGRFVGTPAEEALEYYKQGIMLGAPVRVRIEGYAYYVGYHIFVAEKEDPLAEGGLCSTV